MKIRSTFAFPNGMVAACGIDGRQIPELQGRFSQVAQKILDLADAETQFFGWKGIADGASFTAEELRSMKGPADARGPGPPPYWLHRS